MPSTVRPALTRTGPRAATVPAAAVHSDRIPVHDAKHCRADPSSTTSRRIVARHIPSGPVLRQASAPLVRAVASASR